LKIDKKLGTFEISAQENQSLKQKKCWSITNENKNCSAVHQIYHSFFLFIINIFTISINKLMTPPLVLQYTKFFITQWLKDVHGGKLLFIIYQLMHWFWTLNFQSPHIISYKQILLTKWPFKQKESPHNVLTLNFAFMGLVHVTKPKGKWKK